MTPMSFIGGADQDVDMRYSPWNDLGDNWPGVTVKRVRMTGGRLGEIRAGGWIIALREDVDHHQQRCTLAHELIHLERGTLDCMGQWRSKEERAVHLEAARRLITVEQLAEAIIDVGREDEAPLARYLRVDRLTLRLRRKSMTELELIRVRRLIPEAMTA